MIDITIYSTASYEKPYFQEANSTGLKLHYLEERLDKDTASLAGGSQAVVIFTNDIATAPVLEILHKEGIKYLVTRSMGVDHIDTDKARELGIKIAHVPHYSPYAVAEHSIALMLALNRRLITANQKFQHHDFRLDGLTGFDMHGKTVGILGSGEIGAVSARILHGFGCRLLIFDIQKNTSLIEKYGAKYVTLEELCAQSDIITIHAPLTDDTKHLINRERIASMKKGVMLINVSRGAICHTEDLIEGLKSEQIGYLGMDVYEHEKGLFFKDHSNKLLQDDLFARLLSFKNVLITAHQAFLTREALKEITETTFRNLNAWAEGKKAENELK
jgi:D-lactate dehydrogenase